MDADGNLLVAGDGAVAVAVLQLLAATLDAALDRWAIATHRAMWQRLDEERET